MFQLLIFIDCLLERFRTDLPVLHLHSDRGGEFSSDLLRDFCRGEDILQSFTHPDSPQQNGISERRISLVMEVARTSMIHAAAPHFLWLFAVRYTAHQLNLWPRVSLPDSAYTALDREGWRCVGVPGVSQLDPLPGTAPVEVAVGSGVASSAASGGIESGGAEPGGAEPGGVEPGGAEPGGAEPEGAETEGAGSGGAVPGGEESEGAGSGGAEPWGAEPGGAEPAGVEPWGTTSGGAKPRGSASSGGPAGAPPRLALEVLELEELELLTLELEQPPLQPASPLPAPSPSTEQTGGLTKRHEPPSRPASPVRIGRRVPRPRLPPVPITHARALRPSSIPLRVPLLPPPESSLPTVPDPESDRACAASPTVSRLLATVVTDPSFESTAASAHGAVLRHTRARALLVQIGRAPLLVPPGLLHVRHEERLLHRLHVRQSRRVARLNLLHDVRGDFRHQPVVLLAAQVRLLVCGAARDGTAGAGGDNQQRQRESQKRMSSHIACELMPSETLQ
ncbi:unnamed protein product [Closterium sp. NIES-53]